MIQFPRQEGACRSGEPGPVTLVLPIAVRPLARVRFDPLEKTTRALQPDAVLDLMAECLRQGFTITTVDIAGPGDPLAEIDTTLETLDIVRHQYPDMVLVLTTLGIHADRHAGILRENGLHRVTLLVDAVGQEVANKLYAWIRPDRKTIPIEQATALLLDEQARAVEAFQGAGCPVTIKTTVYPGFNDSHIGEIARVMAERGAEKMVLVPYAPSTILEERLLNPPGRGTMQRLQQQAAEYIDTSLAQDRQESLIADGTGLLDGCADRAGLPRPTAARPNVAVVSSNGMEVDLHLGQAYQVLIYGPRDDGLISLLATRPVPEPGGGSSRWQELSETLADCFVLLAASVGEIPRRILSQAGIPVLIIESEIEGIVDGLYNGNRKGKRGRKLKSTQHTIEKN